jgi:magnesium chelatase subunit I
VVASANPEDYTSRGRIITPLKDRLGSQIRTHYPRTLEDEIAIVRQEKAGFPLEEGVPVVHVPAFMEEIVAELTHLARRSGEISQRSGVSVRVSVANLEVLEAAALKRAVRLGEPAAAPRISDLAAVIASTAGKIELESAGDESPEDRIVERLITKAVYATFNQRIAIDDLEPLVSAFEDGLTLETGDRVHSAEYVRWASEIPGLADAIRRTGVLEAPDEPAGNSPARGSSIAKGPAAEAALVASAIEFLLEGLHLARRLNKDRLGGAVLYRR